MFIQTKSPKITGVVYMTVIYLLGFIAASLYLESYNSLYYIAIQSIITVVVYIAHKRIQYALPLLWSLSLWGLLNLAGQIIPLPPEVPTKDSTQTLGELWLVREIFIYDNLVHFYGFAVATWVSWQTLCRIIHTRYQRRLMPTIGLLLLVVTSSMGYGALNEMIEFLTQLIFNLQHSDTYHSTCWDMIINTLGAMIAAVMIKIRNL